MQTHFHPSGFTDIKELQKNVSDIQLISAVPEDVKTVKHLVVPSKSSLTFRVLERRTLSDLALLCDLGVFDKKDVKFAKKLNTLRNGLAHKNPRVISNLLYSGKEISVLDIDSVITKVDCTPLIIRTICLLVKMSKVDI